MKVTLENFRNQKCPCNLEVDPNTTTDELKEIAAREFGSVPGAIRLAYSGRIFKPGDTLATFGVAENSVIKVFVSGTTASQPAAQSTVESTAPTQPEQSKVEPVQKESVPPQNRLIISNEVLDINDPSLPEYVRNPKERPSFDMALYQQLVDMGFPPRKARNTVRFDKMTAESAVIFITTALETEENNRVVEDMFLLPSAPDSVKEKFCRLIVPHMASAIVETRFPYTANAEKQQKIAQLTEMMTELFTSLDKSRERHSRHSSMFGPGSGFGPGSRFGSGSRFGPGSIFGRRNMFGGGMHRTRYSDRVEDISQEVSSAKADISNISLLLQGKGPLTPIQKEHMDNISKSYNTADRKLFVSFINLLREALVTPDNVFRNVFAVLYFENSLAKNMFGDNLKYAAMMTTEQCRFTIEMLGHGYDFDDICKSIKENDDVNSAAASLASNVKD